MLTVDNDASPFEYAPADLHHMPLIVLKRSIHRTNILLIAVERIKQNIRTEQTNKTEDKILNLQDVKPVN